MDQDLGTFHGSLFTGGGLDILEGALIVRMSEPLGVTISVKVFLMIEMSRSKVVEKHAFG